MTDERFWVLCVSQLTSETDYTVKILATTDVSANGEKLWILALTEDADEANRIRAAFGDQHILRNWQAGIHVDYPAYINQDPHEEVRDRFDD